MFSGRSTKFKGQVTIFKKWAQKFSKQFSAEVMPSKNRVA